MTRVLVVRNKIPGAIVGGGSFSQGDEVAFDAPGIALASVRDSLRSTIEATGVGSSIILPSPFNVPDINTNEYEGYNDSTRDRAIRCLYESADAFDMTIAWDRGSNAVEGEVLRVDWWVRMQTLGGTFPSEADDQGGTSSAGDDWQWKLFRYRFDNDVLDGGASGDFYCAHWDNSDGSFFGGEFPLWHWVNGSSSAGSAPIAPPSIDNASGRRARGDDLPTAYGQLWAKCEVVLFMGTTGTGRAFMYVRHEGSERRLVGHVTGMSWFASGRAFRHWLWQNWIGNATPSLNGTWCAMDDIRVQRHSSAVACDRAILMSHPTLAESYASGGWHEDQHINDITGDTVTIGNLNTGADRTGTCYLAGIGTDPTTRNDSIYGSVQEVTIT